MMALIYKVIDYKEFDKIIYCYSEKGKINFFIKNANKIKSVNQKNAEILNLIEIDNNLNLDKLNNLYEIKVINYNDDIKYKYYDVLNILLIFEVIDRLFLDNNIFDNKLIFEWIYKYLYSKNNNFYDKTNMMLLKLLKPLGILPKFYDKNLPNYGFNYDLQKLTENNYDISNEICYQLDYLLFHKFDEIINIQLNKNIRNYIITYYEKILNLNFKNKGAKL